MFVPPSLRPSTIPPTRPVPAYADWLDEPPGFAHTPPRVHGSSASSDPRYSCFRRLTTRRGPWRGRALYGSHCHPFAEQGLVWRLVAPCPSHGREWRCGEGLELSPDRERFARGVEIPRWLDRSDWPKHRF